MVHFLFRRERLRKTPYPPRTDGKPDSEGRRGAGGYRRHFRHSRRQAAFRHLYWEISNCEAICARIFMAVANVSPRSDVVAVALSLWRDRPIRRMRKRDGSTSPTTRWAADFKAQAEDVYEYHAIETNPSGHLTSNRAEVIGQLRACVGTTDATTAVLYGKGMVNGVTFTTKGTCAIRSNFPNAGFVLVACGEELTDLPPSYVGGQLVTNALSNSMPVGAGDNPSSGYVQSGVTIFRFWRQPNTR